MLDRIEKGKRINRFTRYMVRASVIAALYAAVTLFVYPLSFGYVQIRFSEALAVLPVFMPEAVLGLFVGCVISNIFSPNIVVFDILFGGFATLFAAYLTFLCSKLGKKGRWVAPIPPILINAVVVGFVISFSSTSIGDEAFKAVYLLNFCTVGIGQVFACYGLGIPLTYIFEKLKNKMDVL